MASIIGTGNGAQKIDTIFSGKRRHIIYAQGFEKADELGFKTREDTGSIIDIVGFTGKGEILISNDRILALFDFCGQHFVHLCTVLIQLIFITYERHEHFMTESLFIDLTGNKSQLQRHCRISKVQDFGIARKHILLICYSCSLIIDVGKLYGLGIYAWLNHADAVFQHTLITNKLNGILGSSISLNVLFLLGV